MSEKSKFFPVISVLTVIVMLWYGFSVVPVDYAPWAFDQAKRNSISLSFPELVSETWSQKRPKLPTPHQVATEMWNT